MILDSFAGMNSKIFRWMIVILALLVAAASLGGLLINDMYAAESGDWLAQCLAQDLFDLCIAVPALLLSLLLYEKGSRIAFFLLTGLLVFLIYTFIIYTLSVHFNSFFLVYCFALALSSYSLIVLLYGVGSGTVKGWFGIRQSETVSITYLLFFAALFYLLWLADIIPSIASGKVPAILEQTGLLTNPVHVVDLSFLLPGFVVTAMLLKKRHSLGYVFAPTIMAFSIVMTLSIATIVFYEYAKGFVPQYSVGIAMIVSSILSLLVLLHFTRGLKHG